MLQNNKSRCILEERSPQNIHTTMRDSAFLYKHENRQKAK